MGKRNLKPIRSVNMALRYLLSFPSFVSVGTWVWSYYRCTKNWKLYTLEPFCCFVVISVTLQCVLSLSRLFVAPTRKWMNGLVVRAMKPLGTRFLPALPFIREGSTTTGNRKCALAYFISQRTRAANVFHPI